MPELTREMSIKHGEQIAVLETRMTALETNIMPKLDAIHEQALKHNGRLGKLEGWRTWLTGMVAGVSLIWTVVIIAAKAGLIQFGG